MAIGPTLRLADVMQGRAIVDAEGRPNSDFLRIINGNTRNMGQVITAQGEFLADIVELNNLITAAEAAIAGANEATEAVTKEQALVNSTIDPISVVSAGTANVDIIAHDRIYGDAALTTVPVSAGSVPHGQASATVVYVSYVDVARAGGAVTYQVSTTPPSQTGDTHVVGAVTIPGVGTQAGGSGPLRPGYVEP